jgi:predicted permease
MSDIRFALRAFVKSPGFSVAVVLTLAFGIGATTAIVSTVDAVLLRPLPYTDPDRLVVVWEDNTADGFPQNTPAPGNFADWRDRNRVFAGIAATAGANATITGDGAPEQVLGRRVTANFFDVLGARPLLGRTFTDDEVRQNAPVVVLSHTLWRRRYQADPAVVGRALTMNNARVTVVGVMPEAFVFRNREMEFWSPLFFTPQQAAVRGNHFLNVVARLRPEATIEQARAEMSTIAADLAREYPENEGAGIVVVPIREDVFGETRLQLVVLTAAALCMLLIACANLAGLLLARGAARRRELATRAALGASRPRLVAQSLVEGITWAVAGGIAGLAVAAGGIRVLEALIPTSLAASVQPQIDLRVLAFAMALSVVTGIVFAVIPALVASRVSLTEAMHAGGRTSAGGGRSVSRYALVTLQVAVTFVLLAGAGLMLRSLANLRGVDVGFQTDGLLTMRTALPVPKYAAPLRREQFYDAVLERVRVLPGVTAAGFASTLPFTSQGNTAGVRIEGFPFDSHSPDQPLYRPVTPGYLDALGVTLLEGRLLADADADRAEAPRVAVVNESFARRYWPDASAIGRRIAFSDADAPWMTIVGVVADVHETGYQIAIRPGMYLPSSQLGAPVNNLVVRVAGDPLALAPAVQRVISSVDPEQPVAAVRTMNQIVDLEVVDRRQQSIVLGAFAALALLLATIGLYGLLSYAVAQRRREIGLRIVLGGTPGTVARGVAGRGLLLAALGLAAGVAMAFAATTLMDGLLYGVEPRDLTTFVLVALVLGGVSAVACWIPALRAARVNPQIVLQAD